MKHMLMALTGAVLLAGCGGDIDELRQWMEQQRKEVKPTVTPLVPPKKFLPQPYESAAVVDRFSPQKLRVAIQPGAPQPNWLQCPRPAPKALMSTNTWPTGVRHAMLQSEHEVWNARNYPGTRQLCSACDEPTGRCEDDSLYAEDGSGPYCEECWPSESNPEPDSPSPTSASSPGQ